MIPALRHRTPFAIVLAVAVLVSLPAEASTLVRLDELPALVLESKRALLATVTGVHYGFDERKLHSTFITLAVEDRLYGDEVPAPGGTLEIKLYGALDTMPDGSRLHLDGTPRYTIGDRVLLLLRENSAWGFTSAPGLFQGVFRISEVRGTPFAESLGGNRPVFGEGGLGRWLDPGNVAPEDLSFLGVEDGPVPYSLLRTAILQLWQRGGGR